MNGRLTLSLLTALGLLAAALYFAQQPYNLTPSRQLQNPSLSLPSLDFNVQENETGDQFFGSGA